jgi:hypothetical protein
MTDDELRKIIEKHEKWLEDQEGGERANLCGADLYGANLCGAENVPFIPMSCPDSGSFTAWKKAHGHIV